MADQPGTYRVRVDVELASPDELYPEVSSAQHEAVIEAEGAPCSLR